MAAEQRRVKKQRQEDALAYLQRDKGWHSGPEVAAAIGVPKGSIFGILGRMVGDGKLESRNAAKGGGYRLRQDFTAKAAAEAACEDASSVVEKTEQEISAALGIPGVTLSHGRAPTFDEVAFGYAKTAPATPPAPAPVIPPPEQPANVAAPIPEPSPGPPSFAGNEDTGYVVPSSEAIAESMLQPFAGIIPGTLVSSTGMSRELHILTDLEDLDDAARERVLQYAVDRWWLK